MELRFVDIKISDNGKIKSVRSETYNYKFRKEDGFFVRWGKTLEDDPEFSPVGPEILDMEISTGRCSAGCKFCSPVGTLIKTPNGEIGIEDIKEGDLVIGYNTKNEKLHVQEVEEIYSHEYEGELICIELENGRMLELTPDHEVYVNNKNFIPAKDLKENDKITYLQRSTD